jgi:hypothetical protein
MGQKREFVLRMNGQVFPSKRTSSSGPDRAAGGKPSGVCSCVNLETYKLSADIVLMQLSTKDDSFTMFGASLMVRIANPAVDHSDRPSAGYGVRFEALGSIPSGQRRS